MILAERNATRLLPNLHFMRTGLRHLSSFGPLRQLARSAVLVLLAGVALSSDTDSPETRAAPFNEFQFVRLAYNNFGGPGWLTDWPEAETHLMDGVRRLTRIDAAIENGRLTLMDEALFDYPWLYAVEVGGWYLNPEEAARLRDYLLRGGFLMVDDFHGGAEWDGFMQSMRRVFPDRPVVDIPLNDSVFHVLYDLDNTVQIPGIGAASRGMTYERSDGYPARYRGIYDDKGRLMVVINFNVDLGDAWEHADVPDYALMYTARAYKFAINYMLYAMTH
jgi:hypothetical protein